jgi:hypothetical protein
MAMMTSSSIEYEYCLKAFFEYFYTMHVTGAYDCIPLCWLCCNIQYIVWVLPDGIFGRCFTEMSKCNFYPYISCAMFYYSFALFGITCPMLPCSTEFSAFFEHFFRFLKFLTLAFQKLFPNYLGFACVWHHASCMTMIT